MTVRLVTVMFLWAVCFPLITLGLELAPHLAFATLRALIAGVVVVGLGMAVGRPWPAGKSSWLLLAVAGLGATTLGFLGMFHASEFLTAGVATVVASTQPLLAAVLAYFVLKERLGTLGIAGLGLGFLGVVILAAAGSAAAGQDGDYLIGIGYIVLSAVGITISNVVFKRLAGVVDPVMATGVQLLLGAIPLGVISVVSESPIDITWSTTFILSLVGLALPGTALAYWLWLTALETTTLNHANAFTFLVPLFGISLGVGLYGEELTVIKVLGMTIAVGGIIAVHRDRASRSESRAVPGPAPQPFSRGNSSSGESTGGDSYGGSVHRTPRR